MGMAQEKEKTGRAWDEWLLKVQGREEEVVARGGGGSGTKRWKVKVEGDGERELAVKQERRRV